MVRLCFDGAFGGANQPHVLAFELQLQRHLEQARGAWVAGMETVAEARRLQVGRDAFADNRVSRLVQRPAAAHQRQTAVEEAHARLDVAAMMRAERQDACRHAVLERRAGRGDVARGERRGRRHAVIDRRDQHGVQHPADRRRRQLAHQQQIDRLGEAEAAHHLVEGIAAHENLVRLDVGERRPPAIALNARLRAPIDRCPRHGYAPVTPARPVPTRMLTRVRLRQIVPYNRSPKSPRPGTMYFWSFSLSSTTGV